MRTSLFWKLWLASLALLLVVLAAVDIYSARALRRDYLEATFTRLDSLARLAEGRSPALDDPAALRAWTRWMAASGARVTVIAADGRVLDDSDHDPATMENHAGRPEVQQAFAAGRGEAVRHSHTLGRDLVYLAVRHRNVNGAPVVLRFALPLAQVDAALADIRWRLWSASLVLLLLAALVALLLSRGITRRIRRLEAFSQRVAEGDFTPLPVLREGDELEQLGRALNETAARLDATIRSLTEERNRSAAILSSMSEGVAVVSAEERVLFCNRAFCAPLELEVGACQGRPLLEVVRQPDLLELIRRALAAGAAQTGEITAGAAAPRTFSAIVTPLRANGASGVVMVLHDISELRRLERVRRDFVANVSHEFKTPLTAIQGFAETLLAGALGDEENRQRFLGIIRDHAVRLGRLTDDLLKLARVEAGKVELELHPVAVADVVNAFLETTRLQAGQKGIALEVDLPADLPAVRADARALREVLQNLLDNAVQYTPAGPAGGGAGGRIAVRARAADGQVAIAVTDTGIGIPQADQEKIFERFYRVDAARSREVGGTGLGLSIARHLVESHGGRLTVESEVGKGSTFTVFLPAA